MIKPMENRITKGVIDIGELYSQKSAKEVVSYRVMNQKKLSITDFNKEGVTIQLIVPQQKTAAKIFRNILREIIKKYFRKMLQRVLLKKIAFKLLTSKKKRDVEYSFLMIKTQTLKEEHAKIYNFTKKHTELKIMNLLYSKLQNKNKAIFFSQLTYIAQRQKKMKMLAKILFDNMERSIKRLNNNLFFSHLKTHNFNQIQRESQINNILKIDKFRVTNIQQMAFNKLMDDIFYDQCHNHLQMRKSKNTEMLQFNSSRKQTLNQLRQQLKGMKLNIDQQKLNRNRAFQQRKKFNSTNKTAMSQIVRKFQKQRKGEQSISQQIQGDLNEKERVLAVRDGLKNKSLNSQNRCYELYKLFQSEQGPIVRNLSRFISNIETQLLNFKEGQVFIFRNNMKIQKLVQIYEKREGYNYEAEYYELQYQNNVIKQTIRCFLQEKYQFFIHNHLRQSSMQASQSQDKSQEIDTEEV